MNQMEKIKMIMEMIVSLVCIIEQVGKQWNSGKPTGKQKKEYVEKVIFDEMREIGADPDEHKEATSGIIDAVASMMFPKGR